MPDTMIERVARPSPPAARIVKDGAWLTKMPWTRIIRNKLPIDAALAED